MQIKTIKCPKWSYAIETNDTLKGLLEFNVSICAFPKGSGVKNQKTKKVGGDESNNSNWFQMSFNLLGYPFAFWTGNNKKSVLLHAQAVFL